MRKIKKVACLGAGTVGSGWACYFASKGLNVAVYDISEKQLDSSRKKIMLYLKKNVEYGIINSGDVEKIHQNIRYMTDIGAALKDIQFIQESVLEQYEVKQKIIEQVDEFAPDTAIYASSSSGLLATRLQSYSNRPDKVIIGHPFNPPHLIPLVEIVKGNASDKTVQEAYDFYSQIGKKPIVLNKEVPGHVANRIQAAIWRESIDLVMNGVCSVNDIDTAISSGPGLRMALLGQHMIFNLGGGEGGIEHFMDILGDAFESWWEDMATWVKFPESTQEVIAKGLKEELDGRSISEVVAWRDKNLVGILKLLDLI